MPSRERVAALIARVEAGCFVEALQEFYTDDATMQENGQAPRIGLKKLIDHERGVIAAFKEIRTLPVKTWLVDGDNVIINWVFEFTRADGTGLRMDELALQRWRGDRVAEERFYYDPAQLSARTTPTPTSPA
jgi:ketosteroid isomerase-like protein